MVAIAWKTLFSEKESKYFAGFRKTITGIYYVLMKSLYLYFTISTIVPVHYSEEKKFKSVAYIQNHHILLSSLNVK